MWRDSKWQIRRPYPRLNVFLPLATLVIGLVSKPVSDWLDSRRIREREREARREKRRDEVFERRNVFQRETLLKLQDAIAEGLKEASTIWSYRLARLKVAGDGSNVDLPAHLTKPRDDALLHVNVLYVRVRDETARALVEQFIVSMATAEKVSERDDLEKAIGSCFAAQTSVNQHIGHLLRELDDHIGIGNG